MIFILSVDRAQWNIYFCSGKFIFAVQNDPNIVVIIYLYTVCGDPLLTVSTLCPIGSVCVCVTNI